MARCAKPRSANESKTMVSIGMVAAGGIAGDGRTVAVLALESSIIYARPELAASQISRPCGLAALRPWHRRLDVRVLKSAGLRGI